MPDWMKIAYVFVLRDRRKLEDIWFAKGPQGELLVSPKERVPPKYERVSDIKRYIESLRYENTDQKI